MLERDYLMIQYMSKEIIDRRLNVLKSGMIRDAASGKEKPYLVSTLNFVGILVLTLFLLLMPV
jgi:hypothetical protein